MRTAVVTTTIHVPEVLEAYARTLDHHGHTDSAGDNVAMIVIGDRKTPAEVASFARRLAADSGIAVDFWDVGRQRDHLRSYPDLDRLLPYDSIQRRNLAYVLAVREGFDRIVTIDDDNWPTADDFLAGHAVVGTTVTTAAVAGSSGWFNTASLLVTDPERPLFHRGFPTDKRRPYEITGELTVSGRVVVNVGLWTGVPDADAVTHLDSPVRVLGLRDAVPDRLAVAAGTMTVFNTQNTAFHRDLLACMYLPPMGGTIGGLTVGRYDDIWMSMMAKPIVDHLGDLVTVGRPMVEQRRNDHDLFADALVELPAMRLTNSLVSILAGLRLTGDSYHSCYRQAVAHLRRCATEAPADHRLDGDQAAYLIGLTAGMEAWADIIDGLGLV